jgi:Secretion system C-terminal sorting domain
LIKYVAHILLLQCIVVICHAQSMANNEWYVGIEKNKLSFYSDTINTSRFFAADSQYYYLVNGQSSICDTNGQLLLACSPFSVFNGSSSGFVIGGDSIYNKVYTNVEVGTSSVSNTSLIVPKGDNQFYIFLTTISDSLMTEFTNLGSGQVDFEMDEIRYCVVDMSANNGQGEVISNKNLLLHTTTKPHLNGTCFTACMHANGRDWWLIKPSASDRRIRYKFLITPDSIYTYKDENLPSLTSGVVYHYIGQSCFSQDGTLYAESNADCPTTIWNFNRCTGEFTLKRIFDLKKNNKDSTNPSPTATGVCFSADNRYLYQGEFFAMYQLDLNEADDKKAVYCYCEPDTSKKFSLNHNIQMTPTGQIYIGHWHGLSPDINAIMRPSQFQADANFKFNYGFVQSNVATGGTLPTADPPNIFNYALGALQGSPCDTLNKPPPLDTTNKNTVWQLGPNPADNFINIKVPGVDAKVLAVQVYNVLGQRVQNAQYSLDNTLIVQHNVATLAAGVYVVQVQVNGRNFHKEKIVVR